MVLSLIIFFIFLLADLYIIYKQKNKYRILTKPFIMPSLIFYYTQITTSVNELILAALILATIGDICLLSRQLIYLGIGGFSFLMGHVCYIIAFLINIHHFELKPIYLVLLIIYLLFLYIINRTLFRKSNKSIKILAGVYFPILLLMSFIAFMQLTSINFNSFLLIYTGAILFTISDLMLFIKKIETRPLLDLPVMSAYAIGQLLIVIGFSILTYI